jgi:hypothetical protein
MLVWIGRRTGKFLLVVELLAGREVFLGLALYHHARLEGDGLRSLALWVVSMQTPNSGNAAVVATL